MRRMTWSAPAVIVLVAAIGIAGRAQAPGQDRGPGQGRRGAQGQPPVVSPAGQAAARGGPAEPLYKLEDAFLQWPLLPADRAYGAIDGHHLHQLVEDQTAISRRYRDQGQSAVLGSRHRLLGRRGEPTVDAEQGQADGPDGRAESADTVPWTGLESTTRAYAKIIDGVNMLDLKDLQRAPEVAPTQPR